LNTIFDDFWKLWGQATITVTALRAIGHGGNSMSWSDVRR
jgi:hypothetical protein